MLMKIKLYLEKKIYVLYFGRLFFILSVFIFACLLTFSFLSDFKEVLFLMNNLKINIFRQRKKYHK